MTLSDFPNVSLPKDFNKNLKKNIQLLANAVKDGLITQEDINSGKVNISNVQKFLKK